MFAADGLYLGDRDASKYLFCYFIVSNICFCKYLFYLEVMISLNSDLYFIILKVVLIAREMCFNEKRLQKVQDNLL